MLNTLLTHPPAQSLANELQHSNTLGLEGNLQKKLNSSLILGGSSSPGPCFLHIYTLRPEDPQGEASVPLCWQQAWGHFLDLPSP
jgi:hypothetical protein